MEKEFVSYEQALALKKIGFDEECLATYVGEVLDLTLQTLNDDYFTVAPLKQQVFRWFRKKNYNHSFIELVYHNGVKFDYVIYVNKSEDECFNYGDGPFEICEEAESACINKLIELAKQQDNGK